MSSQAERLTNREDFIQKKAENTTFQCRQKPYSIPLKTFHLNKQQPLLLSLPWWTLSSASLLRGTSVLLKRSAWRSPPPLCCKDELGNKLGWECPRRLHHCSWGSAAADHAGTGDMLPGQPPRSSPSRNNHSCGGRGDRVQIRSALASSWAETAHNYLNL